MSYKFFASRINIILLNNINLTPKIIQNISTMYMSTMSTFKQKVQNIKIVKLMRKKVYRPQKCMNNFRFYTQLSAGISMSKSHF